MMSTNKENMIGTNKEEVKEFVERFLINYRESIGYKVIGINPEDQQDFINGKLYNLYIDAKRSSSESTLNLLKEVLDEYPGFNNYFAEHYDGSDQKAPDLSWCDYVGRPAARKFWGLDPIS